MTILVTGGCGYKGSVLVPKLLTKGYQVRVVDIQWFGNHLKPHPHLKVIQGDTRNPKIEWFDNVNAIIHLAAVANDPSADLSPKLTWEIGPLATMRLAEMSILCGVKQFIYASSSSVYGVSDEPDVIETLPLNPISDYNKSKMVTERVLLSYQDHFALQIIRPATVCGFSPRMRLDVSVNMLTLQALMNGVITVFGGDQTRPNIHIDDITDLYSFLLDNPNAMGIYNAGFENISILDIAKLVQKVMPCEIKVTPSNDPRSYHVNSDKLLGTGFKPKKTVEKAIHEIIEKYKAGEIVASDQCYNVKTMKKLEGMNSGT